MSNPALRAPIAAIVFVTIILAFGIQVAYADAADVPILTSILTTALEQLDTATQALQTLGKAYRETKQIASYATQAKQAFSEIQSFTSSRAGSSGLRALFRAFPELSFLEGAAKSKHGSLGLGYAGLSPELQRCLQDISGDTTKAAGTGGGTAGRGSACKEWQKTVTAQKLDQDLRRTFGEVPGSRPELARVRAEDIASEQRYQAEFLKKAAVEKQVYDPNGGMLEKCRTARDPVVCQTLSAQAQIQTLEQQAETNRKLEDIIHQQAVSNEARIAEAKRLEDEETARRAALVEGLRAFGWNGSAEPTGASPPSPAPAPAPGSGR